MAKTIREADTNQEGLMAVLKNFNNYVSDYYKAQKASGFKDINKSMN